jgi:Mitochondrial ribosomal protein (VAR1)
MINLIALKYAILSFLYSYKQKKAQKNFNNFLIKNYKFNKKIKNYINFNLNFKSGNFISRTNNYSYRKFNQLNISIRKNIYEFLHGSFLSMFSLISKPIFVIKSDKIIIQFFYFLFKNNKISKNNQNLSKTKSTFILENKNKLNIICNILKRFLKKKIELELVRLYLPYYNSNILVNFFGIFINKIRLQKIVNKFLIKSITNISTNNLAIKKKNELLPSSLSGIKIKVAGRLLTQRVIPRMTTKLYNNGSFARPKTILVETSRFTNKNKRGAFSLTISIGHKLNNINLNPLYRNQVRNFHISSVNFRLTQKERSNIKLTQKQIDILIGTLLGNYFIAKKKL